jgi:hypothetical protein
MVGVGSTAAVSLAVTVNPAAENTAHATDDTTREEATAASATRTLGAKRR